MYFKRNKFKFDFLNTQNYLTEVHKYICTSTIILYYHFTVHGRHYNHTFNINKAHKNKVKLKNAVPG